MKKNEKIIAGASEIVGVDVRQRIGVADVLEWQLPRDVLNTLLLDRTTGKNIVWGM